MRNQITNFNRISNATRIFAKGVEVSNNTRKTGLNNNDLIIGPAGAGKTRGYIIPYILHSEESMIIADTKGNLANQYGSYLKRRGYDVKVVDFKDVEASECGYNPLDYIRVRDGIVNDLDLMRVVDTLCPPQDAKEPFWDNSAKLLIAAFISYIMEVGDEKSRNLQTVCELYRNAFGKDEKDNIVLAPRLQEYCDEYPNRAFSRKMGEFNTMAGAKVTLGCIMMFINSLFSAIDTETVGHFLSMENKVRFSDFFDHKVALFLNVSDNDRSLDVLVNTLYTQALQEFINGADKLPDSRMPIPVRFLLDDFATNTVIPNFDGIISVIRSREISVSLIVQSFSQLESLYGEHAAKTIKANCEHWLFLGSLDYGTAEEMARRIDVRLNTVLDMPLNQAYLIARGGKPQKVKKYDLEEDSVYRQLNAAARKKRPSEPTAPETPVA